MLIADLDILTLALAYLVTIVGALAHYVKKWYRGEIVTNLYDYLFVNHKRYTVFVLMTLAGVAFTSVTALGMPPLTVQAITTLFLAGYAIDSTVNKDAKV